MNVEQAAAEYRAATAKVDELKHVYEPQLRAARDEVAAARVALAETIVTAYLAGDRVGDLAQRSGYSRESIRLILRAAGIEAE